MSPWWSVAGQCSDIVGFIVITLDVWPEYKLSRLKEEIDWQHRAMMSYAREEKREDHIQRLAQGALSGLAQTQMDTLRRRLRLPPIAEGRDLPTMEQVERSIEETREALLVKTEKLAKRSRPPLGFGVLCVLAGFAMQVAGSWPQSH